MHLRGLAYRGQHGQTNNQKVADKRIGNIVQSNQKAGQGKGDRREGFDQKRVSQGADDANRTRSPCGGAVPGIGRLVSCCKAWMNPLHASAHVAKLMRTRARIEFSRFLCLSKWRRSSRGMGQEMLQFWHQAHPSQLCQDCRSHPTLSARIFLA